MKHIDLKYKYSEETSQIIACAIEVHNILGNSFQKVIKQIIKRLNQNFQKSPFRGFRGKKTHSYENRDGGHLIQGFSPQTPKGA